MTAPQRDGQARAAVVAMAPAVLLLAFVLHPYLRGLPDPQAVADAVQENTTRWGFAHLLTALASVLVALAFLAVRAYLRAAGEDRFSSWGLPLVIFASACYGFLPGLEFAPLAVAEAGGDVVAAQEALQAWFIPVFITGAIAFGLGIFAFARGIVDSRILSPAMTKTVVTALAVMAVSRAVPLGLVQFYVQALAGLLALWPLAHVMWRRSEAVAAARSPRTASAV